MTSDRPLDDEEIATVRGQEPADADEAGAAAPAGATDTGVMMDAADIAERLNSVLADPALAESMGRAGRHRAVEQFSWTTIAAETAALYTTLI